VTPADYQRARRILIRRDPVLASLIRRHGPCGLAAAQRADHFSALVRAITGQQLSTKAAATIYARMVTLVESTPGGGPTVDGFARATDDALRGAGMSRQKIGYLRDLCGKIAAGVVNLEALDDLPDEDVIDALVKVKGIGRWSAEMFLIFRLHRPDVLPVDDLGIVVAVQRAYGLRQRPKADRLRKIGEAWRPYRSVASWYLWRSLDNEPVAAATAPPRSRRVRS
jgi:DNA-3-methyladenine glycosylase II